MLQEQILSGKCHCYSCSKKMRRSFCSISLATSILEDWDIFHLKGDIHSFDFEYNQFSVRYRGAEIWAKQNGVSDSKNTKYCITSVLAKKRPTQNAYFWSQKNVYYVIYFYSCLKMVFCELMLLELGDLLGLSLFRNFFNAARSTFSCKYFSKIAQYFQFF